MLSLDGQKVEISLGGNFDPIPMDKYTVQIASVKPKKHFNKWKGAEEIMLNYQFTVLDDKPMTEEGGTTRGRLLWHMMAPSMGSKAWLLKLVKAVVGRDLTKEEMEKFDPESIVGKQVDVMVEQNPSKDGNAVFNNVVAYSKTVKPLSPVEVPTASTKAVETKVTTPAPIFEDPLKGQGLDVLGDDPFGKKPETPASKAVVVEEDEDTNDSDEDEVEETPEELELKLKLAKAKAKAKAAKKKS